MEEKLEADLKEFCSQALALGAAEAVVIDAHDIVLDPRVRMKCRIPLCVSYGVNLMCPPNVMAPDDFGKALARYSRALIVRLGIPFSTEQVQTIEEAESLSNLHKQGGLRPTMAEGAKVLSRVLGRLEAECFKQGYAFAAALGAGSCKLCDECVTLQSGLPCKHPFEARPAMEAMGIDVFTTAKRAGLSLSRTATEGVSWVGLVLVD